jgi:hypothetical protein
MRSLLAGVVFFSLGYPGWGLVFVVLALLGLIPPFEVVRPLVWPMGLKDGRDGEATQS